MKALFRNSLIATLCASAGIALSAGSAAAQVSESVGFEGTVANTCSFSNPVDGDLNVDANNAALLTSVGTDATVELTCTGGTAAISVAPPAASSPTDTTSTGLLDSAVSVITTAGDGVGTAAENIDGTEIDSSVNAAGTGVTLSVGLEIESDAPIPSGTYNYSVAVTATAN